jgi:hypothetical protein
MPEPLSASDAISPAFNRTGKGMFKPFRFGLWWRIALISLLTGESMSGGCSTSGGDFSDFSWPGESDGSGDAFLALAGGPNWDQLWQQWAFWILFGIVALIALSFIFLYIASVFRFILFDAVLNDRYRIREGWRRWQESGAWFFVWQVLLNLVISTVALVLIGLPVLLAWSAGIFRYPARHMAILVLGGTVLFFVFLAIVIAGAVVALFARDFLVPVMALENLGIMDGWRRLLPMLKAEKGPYTIYVLMKIVLAIGSAILFAILNVILFLGFFIVIGVATFAIVMAGKSAGLVWDVYTISAAATAGIVILLGLLYLMALVYAPAAYFFQSFSLVFFGSRYPRLGAILNPPPPAPPSPPSTPPPVSPVPSPLS